MNVPFYAETAIFQQWTALAYLIAASLLMSNKDNRWEFIAAGAVCAYIAFDERFMFHECIRLSFPEVKKAIHGDVTILILSLSGILGTCWGVLKLSKDWIEKTLYILAMCLCSLQIYLDVFEKKLFYLEIDVKIEELSEITLAMILIIIACKARVKKRFFVISPLLIVSFYLLETKIHNMIWAICPRLKVFY